MRYNFDRRKGEVFTTFFEGAQTNICYNALDRHIEQGRGSQPCFLWEVCSSVQCIMPTRNFNRCAQLMKTTVGCVNRACQIAWE